ncbi:reverse transcriptase family protein [Microlunatus soli]|uniref:RNA-directed DNA polymerase n=1 Tax=Microlunatus soli TaxID=630515 RepID=A0A1H1NEX0_9ACTN|nr:reverse transcriptase family protein [Microlunatus soli]SDR97546.1 Reverse transcriptase (RNA-dependent DNA polymerase) [Microlunatus soli]
MSSKTVQDDLARRLGYRMLAVEWDRDHLLIGCRRALGSAPPWLGPVIDAVLQQYPVKPSGRHHELTALIASTEEFQDAVFVSRSGRHWQIRSLPVGDLDPDELRMATSRWPVPTLGTEAALADLLRVDLPVLLWLADPKRMLRRRPDGGLQPYRYRWLERHGRTPRLLEIPGPLLRHVQRRLLERVIDRIPPHPAAYGFVRGGGPHRNAAQHVGADWVINFDLRSFFAGVRTGRVAGIFTAAGYPASVVALLAGLVSRPTPEFVLRGMPDGGDPSDRALLRARLRAAHLPQGSPSSPAIANLVAFNLDCRLNRLAKNAGFGYTRYADDLTFSGSGPRPAAGFVPLVRKIIIDEGFAPNDRKLRIRGRGQRQLVTGIVVNQHTNLRRRDHDRLRAVLHDAIRNGPDAANRDHHPDFRAHLEGRVGWAEQLNPTRGARLRRQLELISWPS